MVKITPTDCDSTPNSRTEMVGRAEGIGSRVRVPSGMDRRVASVRLTEEGERRLAATVGELRSDRQWPVGVVSTLADSEAVSPLPASSGSTASPVWTTHNDQKEP